MNTTLIAALHVVHLPGARQAGLPTNLRKLHPHRQIPACGDTVWLTPTFPEVVSEVSWLYDGTPKLRFADPLMCAGIGVQEIHDELTRHGYAPITAWDIAELDRLYPPDELGN